MTLPLPWNDELARQGWREMLLLDRSMSKQMRDILADAAYNAGQLARNVGSKTLSETVRRAQYSAVEGQLRGLQATLWGEVVDVTQAYRLQSSGLAKEFTELLAGATATQFEQQALKESFEAAARNSVRNVQSRLANPVDLSRRVQKHEAWSAGKVDKAINRGIALNRSAAEIAQSVHRFMSPTTPGGASYAAMRIGRTELNNAFHNTSRESYAKQPWIEAVRWYLSGSHPFHDECDDLAEQDGFNLGPGMFPPGDVPVKPHPHCLCYIAASTVSQQKFEEQLLSGEYDQWLEDAGRAPVGAPRPATPQPLPGTTPILTPPAPGPVVTPAPAAPAPASATTKKLAQTFKKEWADPFDDRYIDDVIKWQRDYSKSRLGPSYNLKADRFIDDIISSWGADSQPIRDIIGSLSKGDINAVRRQLSLAETLATDASYGGSVHAGISAEELVGHWAARQEASRAAAYAVHGDTITLYRGVKITEEWGDDVWQSLLAGDTDLSIASYEFESWTMDIRTGKDFAVSTSPKNRFMLFEKEVSVEDLAFSYLEDFSMRTMGGGEVVWFNSEAALLPTSAVRDGSRLVVNVS